MRQSVFDFEDGDFLIRMSDNMAMDSDGNIMHRISDTMAMDIDRGELHFTSSWESDDDE